MSNRAFFCVFLVLFSVSGCDFFNKGVDDYLQQARALRDQGELRASIIEYKNALQAAPQNATARWELGLVYLQMGDGPSAEKEILRAKSINFNNANADSFPVEVAFAQALMLQEDYKRIVQEITIEPYLGPGERYALLAIQAKAHLALNQLDQLKAIETSLLNSAPQANETLLVQSYVLGAQRQHSGASKLLHKVLERDLSNKEAWMYLGEMEIVQGRYEEAIQAFNKVNEIAPYDLLAWYQLGLAAIANKDLQLAQQSTQEIKKQNPNNLLARQIQGLIYVEQENFKEAQLAFEEVVKVDGRFAPALYFAGFSHLMQSQFEQAAVYFRRFLTEQPNHIPARKLFAIALFQQQRFAEIPKQLEPVMQAGEADARSLQILGASYIHLGEIDKGLALAHRAVDMAPDSAAAQYQLADGLFSAGETVQAMRLLENITDLRPEYSLAHLMLALNHLSDGNSTEALKIAESALQKSPDSVDAYLLKLTILQHQNKWNEAEVILSSLVNKFPNNAAVYLALGSYKALRNESVAAQSAFKKVLELQPNHVGAFMRLAKLERDQKNVEAMGHWLEKANSVDPAAMEPALAYADYLVTVAKAPQALRVLGQVEENSRISTYYISVLAQTQLTAGEIDQAVISFKKLSELQPNSAPVRLALARTRLLDKDKKGALSDLEKVLQLDPDNLQAHIQRTQLLFEEGQLNVAHRAMDELLILHPKSTAVLNLQGWIALREKNYDLAVKAYEQVWSELSIPGIAVEYARALIGHDEKRQAVELLESALKQFPENADLLFTLAQAYESVGNETSAIEAYSKVLNVMPNNHVVLNNLAWLIRDKEPSRALNLATRAYEVAPEVAAILDTYGMILFANGEAVKAERHLEKAYRLSDQAPNIGYHYAVILMENKKSVTAKRVLEEALARTEKFAEAQEAEKLLSKLK